MIALPSSIIMQFAVKKTTKTLGNTCLICFIIFISVTYIEGAASKLLEENGVVIGVQYKPKDTEDTKVSC